MDAFYSVSRALRRDNPVPKSAAIPITLLLTEPAHVLLHDVPGP